MYSYQWKHRPYHLIPLLLGALLLLFLIFEMIRRRNYTSKKIPLFGTPKNSSQAIKSSIMVENHHASTSWPTWFANGQNPRLQHLFQALDGTKITGNPYLDTQILFNPGTIICLRNDLGFLTNQNEKDIQCETLPSLDSFGTLKYQWIVEHSPYYCHQGTNAIRLKHRFSEQYLGWNENKQDYDLLTIPDQGQTSSFFAVTSNVVSPRGDIFTTCLFDVNAALRYFSRKLRTPVQPLNEHSSLMLGSKMLQQQRHAELPSGKSGNQRSCQRPWQWTIIPISSFSQQTLYPSTYANSAKVNKMNEFSLSQPSPYSSYASTLKINQDKDAHEFSNAHANANANANYLPLTTNPLLTLSEDFRFSKLFHPLGV